MRRGNNAGWHVEGDKIVYVNLGADYCAEHEMGIRHLWQTLGVSLDQASKPHGIERRRISSHESVKMYEHRCQVLIICGDPWMMRHFEQAKDKAGMAKAWKEHVPSRLGLYGEETLAAAWDERSFGLLGKGEDAKRLKVLYKEIEAHNVAIWAGGRVSPFENGGLIIAVISNVAPEHLETMRAADDDAEKLKAASAATGILERLAKAGKRYYACEPDWWDKKFNPKNRELATKHPVIYWLNPMHQDQNNYGWLTVEDLDMWIEGRGIIPKTEAQKEA
jgi:hypothetical protein